MVHSWTALGQVIASLLSLPSLFASACSHPCCIFLLTLRVCFLEVVVRADATETFSSCPHAGASLTAPMAVPSSTGTVPVSASTVPVSVSTVPSSSGSVASASALRGGGCGQPPVIPSVLRDDRTPPLSGDFVSSHDGILALIQDKLWTLQSQLIPENPLQPVPYVASGSQSAELFTPVGWSRVFDGCVLLFLYCCGPMCPG